MNQELKNFSKETMEAGALYIRMLKACCQLRKLGSIVFWVLIAMGVIICGLAIVAFRQGGILVLPYSVFLVLGAFIAKIGFEAIAIALEALTRISVGKNRLENQKELSVFIKENESQEAFDAYQEKFK